MPPSGSRERSSITPAPGYRTSLQHLDLVSQRSREFELLALNGTPQPFAQLQQRGALLHGRRIRRLVGLAHMLCAAVHPAQQLTQASFECAVTVSATEPSGSAELAQARRAERTAHCVLLQHHGLLLDRLQEVA